MQATVESAEDRLAYLKSKLREKRVSLCMELTQVQTTASSNNERIVVQELNDTTFLELFAGEAGLTEAVRKAGMPVMDPGDIREGPRVALMLDLTDNKTFKKLKSMIKCKKIRWLHMAPPCRSFSRARRRDRWARVRKLRSHSKPEGLEPKNALVMEANLLAARTAQLATLQHKVNGWFSIENPANSFIWLLKSMTRVAKNQTVNKVVGDQCMFGGEYVKPTLWLTNAPHLNILAKRCPGLPKHVHEKLVGFTKNFWGESVFKTSLAAEYPQGLCEELAKSYSLELKHHPFRKEVEEVVSKEDSRGPNDVSKAADRERENEECVGGLRNPHRSIQKVPKWLTVGLKLWRRVDDFQKKLNNNVDLVGYIGKDVDESLEPYVRCLQQNLGSCFKIPQAPTGCGLWSEFLSVLVKLAQDPDEEAATWPLAGTPLGIRETIPFGGVFPKVEEGQCLEEATRLEAIRSLEGAGANYSTYEEHKEDADLVFNREVQKGYATWSQSKVDLEKKYGKLVMSSIAVIVKMKKEGKKVRLVHDLRRSGINETIKVEERLVLPRLRDVIEDAMTLYEACSPDETVCLLSLDFKDAFKQLPVRDSEKRFLSGMAGGGFFVYQVVLFGVRTGPLVWARMAALISRLTQSVFSGKRFRLQTYVDDPLILMRGSEQQIQDMMSKVLWIWLATGLQISWNKGITGKKTEWIGTTIRLDDTDKSINLSISKEKVEDWKGLLRQLNHKPVVSKKLLVQFTGKMSWAAGFIRQLKPFVRMLHTALSMRTKVSDKGAVYHKQVEPALNWFSHLFEGMSGGLNWKVTAHVRHHCCLEVTLDASPWGGGAIKMHEGQPVQTLSLVWSKLDEENTGGKIGDPGSQAIWECYMVLRSLWCWLKSGQQGFVRIRGDAQGVLSALLKRSAESPLLNVVVREITLVLAADFRSLETIHIWSEYNKLADALSRVKDPNQPAKHPAELKSVPHLEDAPQFWRGAVEKHIVMQLALYGP